MDPPGVSSAASSNRPTMATPNTQRKNLLSYSQAIHRHSERVKDTSSYPGVNYRRLDLFLQGSTYPKKPGVYAPNSQSFHFFVLHDLAVDVSDAGRVCFLDGDNDPKTLETYQRPKADSGQLIFLRGYPSPEWLNTIGTVYRIDPEFFRRHLSLGPSKEYFDMPSLPSSSRNIINLKLTSIGRWDVAWSKHQHTIEAMQNHFWHLGMITGVGESIIRRFTGHDEEHFTIEQNASICITKKGSGWAGKQCSNCSSLYCHGTDFWSPPVIIMLDNGRNIADHPEGPGAKIFSSKQLNDVFLPVIRFKPSIALEAPTSGVLDTQLQDGDDGEESKSNTNQSASLLHTRSYGYYMDHATMQTDAFYALHDLFLFSAYSENHFLNMVQTKLTTESQRADDERHRERSLLTLKRHQRLLHDHVQDLRTTIKVIKKRGDSDWPRAKGEAQIEEAQRAALSLQEDFEELEHRGEKLLQQCGVGMEDLRNNVILSESRQAMGLQTRVARLSLLAFFFIPLGFTTSFFGMNFKELGNDMSIWVWFVTSFPVFLMASILCFWDAVYTSLCSLFNRPG